MERFKKRLSKDELEEFEKTTFADVVHELHRIQREQEQFKTMVNLARIETFLKAMEQFGKVIEVFLNVSRIVCFVWGPIKFIVQVSCIFSFPLKLSGPWHGHLETISKGVHLLFVF